MLRLLGELRRARYVPLVLLADDGPLRERLETIGVEVIVRKVSVITRPVFRSWRIVKFLLGLPVSVFQIWRLIRQRQIDIVHANTGVLVTSGLAAKLARVPHIWHIRDWFQEFKAIWFPYSRYILWSSARVLAVSRAVAEQFPPSAKVEVIHNGFSLMSSRCRKRNWRAFRERFKLMMNSSPAASAESNGS